MFSHLAYCIYSKLKIRLVCKFVGGLNLRGVRRLGLDPGLAPLRVQAASLVGRLGAFRCVDSFFLALNTRHWTVPIGIDFAAAISWYSHSSTKRKVNASRSRDSRNDIHR